MPKCRVAVSGPLGYLQTPMDLLQRATPEEQLVEVTRGSVDIHTVPELKERLARSYREKIPLVVKTPVPIIAVTTSAVAAGHPSGRPPVIS